MGWQSRNRAIGQGLLYTIVVHEAAPKDGGGFWAEVPDLPGCFASGETLSELKQDAAEAIESHVSALRQVGKGIPCPIARSSDCQ
jgi:antitoxin HicB